MNEGHGVGGSSDRRRDSGMQEIFPVCCEPGKHRRVKYREWSLWLVTTAMAPDLERPPKWRLFLIAPSEAEGRHEIPALVLNDVRTFQTLESSFGIFVAKSCGLFVIGLCRSRVLRAASSALGKCGHSFHCPRMILRGGLFKERSRRSIVFRAADAIGGHESELILRLRGVCIRRSRQHGPGLDGIGRRATTGGKCSKIANAPGIPSLGCALEELARCRFILCDAGSGAKQNTEFDHRRCASLVGRFAPGADRFRHLSVRGIGAAKLVKSAPG